jgi:hypothetical protein
MQGPARTALTLALTLVFPGGGGAQMLHPGYGVVGAPMSTFIGSSYLTQKVVNDTSFRKSLGGGKLALRPGASIASGDLVTFAPAAGAKVTETLAGAYPPTSRAQAQRVFEELLAGYRKIEQRFQIPPRDLAGATAAFIAGSYMGYRNVDFPDASFPPLVAQMRGLLADVPGVRGASDAQKQEMYEMMAILGMFMATTQMALKQQPDPKAEAAMRQAAQGYLEQFLKTDAQRVQIGAQGVVLQ